MLAVVVLSQAALDRVNASHPTRAPREISEKFMSNFNWKSLSLLAAVVVVGAIILLIGFVTTLRLPLLGWSGLATLVFLVILTVISCRYKGAAAIVDGTDESTEPKASAIEIPRVI